MEKVSAAEPKQKHRNAKERARQVEQYRASGLTEEGYAKRIGVSVWSLRRWLAEAGDEERPKPRRFLPVRIVPDEAGADWLEVVLEVGATLRVPAAIAPERLEALVTAVRAAC